jgi:uncharacterized protein YycO
MSIAEELIRPFFEAVLWESIKRIGSAVRWVFLRKKYSYPDIYDQSWNGRVGLLTLALSLTLFIVLKLKFDNAGNNLEIAKTEVKTLSDQDQLRNGDLIFQTSLSSQSKAIQLATKSRYSHCGIIYKEGNDFFVFEAVHPVKRTPLDQWIARGKEGKYVIKRLKNADQVLTPATLKKMKAVGETFNGKNYDLTFEWSDNKVYCSELIWKMYKRATGIEIGKLEKLSDFDLTHEAVQKKMKERYGNHIPTDELVISPAAIFDSELLILVKSNE